MNNNEKRKISEFDNIKELIYDSVTRYSENIAFVTKIKDGKNVEYINHTYSDLLEDINSFGTSLYSLGLKNKRVAVIGRNRYEWAVAHLSNLFGNIVSIPLDKDLQENELEDSLIRSKADCIVFDSKCEQEISNIKKKNNVNIKEYICMDKIDGYKCFKDLIDQGKNEISKGNEEFINCKVDSENLSILLFTSGTTSKSKAVMLTQKGIAINVYDLLLVETFYPTDVNIAFLPFHHIFGSTAMLVMLASGLKTVFPDGLRYIKQNLKEYKISVFVGVPLLIDKMYSNIENEIEKQGKTKLINMVKAISNFLLKLHIDVRRKLFKKVLDGLGGSMRLIVSGGAPLDKKVAKGFNELGVHLVQGYGLTETSPVIAAENDNFVRYGSVGFPMKHVTLEVVDKDENGIGKIRVKGPNVMIGYYDNEEATNEVLKDGWFYTGDLGYIDKDGFLFITGRSKDVIVLKNGKKVFPEELETLVNRIEEVEESFVYGMPDEEDKNDVKVSVKVVYNKEIVKSKYGKIDTEELRNIIWEKIKEINKSFPRYKYIKNMILTDKELIKTTTKKIKRNEEMKLIIKN